jgi:two-component system, OmpR family, response regulator MprA
MRLLVVEDEPKLGALILRSLRAEGHAVDHCETGEDAFWRAGSRAYDAIVLDIGLPGIDGFETCRRLRADGVWAPVLMLTARDAVGDRVAGLDAGADDYLVKPFALEELHARLRALLRRAAGTETDVLRFSDVKLDMGTREVRRGERRIELTRTEFLLLELFLRNARQVLTRSVIFDRVWDYDFGPRSNALEVYVSYLRRKLEAGAEPRLIHTVRGVGYVLREQ